jgi:hypothetical protein
LIIEPCANRGPARDNPYYRGLGCADFSEQRRPGGAVGIIGGFSPIALKINDPRREVLLAPAHRPRCISSRSPKFRRIDETEIELWLFISASRPQSYSRTAGSSKRSPGRAMASRPSTIEQKSSAACCSPAVAGQGATRESRAPIFGAASSRQTCSLLRLPSGLLEEPGCTISEGFVPHIVRFGSVAKASIFPKSDPIALLGAEPFEHHHPKSLFPFK